MFHARSKNICWGSCGAGTGSRIYAVCVIIAFFCFALQPAGAQLRFRANSAHGALWRRLYIALPTPWKAQDLVYVRELADEEMDRFIEEFEGPNSKADSIVDGCYQASPGARDRAGEITLRESLRGENAALVFMHEYGHYIWANLLTDADHSRYRSIWREQKRRKSLITAYAAESDEEGFAEAFAFFIRRPTTLRKADGKSWTFLCELQELGISPSPEGLSN